jgi:hypothetical protein
MDPRLLSAEHPTGLCFELPAQGHLVLPFAGARQQRPAAKT